MIKILYAKNDFLPNNCANAIQMMNTAHAISRAGGEVCVLVKRKERVASDSIHSYYGLEPVKNFKIKLIFVPFFLRWAFFENVYFTVCAVSFSLWSIIFKKVNILYFIGITRYLAGLALFKKIKRFKIVVELHQPCLRKDIFTRIEHMYKKGSFDAVITISQALKNELVKLGMSAAKIEVAHSAVKPYEKPVISKKNLLRELGIPFTDEQRIIIYGGHLYASKGVGVLIKGFNILQRRFKNARLLILGGNSAADLSQLKDLTRKLEIEDYVYFTGPVEPMAVNKYYCVSDIGVVPTPDDGFWRFSSPLKLSEYMESGLAVVASRLDCVVEKIKDGENGLLFKPSDENDLAEKLAFVLENDSTLERLKVASKKSAAEFNYSKRAGIILNFLETLVKV